jgi:hypothetical protein
MFVSLPHKPLYLYHAPEAYMDVVALFIKLGESLFQGGFVTVEVATCATWVS